MLYHIFIHFAQTKGYAMCSRCGRLNRTTNIPLAEMKKKVIEIDFIEIALLSGGREGNVRIYTSDENAYWELPYESTLSHLAHGLSFFSVGSEEVITTILRALCPALDSDEKQGHRMDMLVVLSKTSPTFPGLNMGLRVNRV